MKYFIETYGCQMNLAESDTLYQLLSSAGHTLAEKPEDADVAIINTCSVRLTAETRVEGRIGFYRGINSRKEKQTRVVLMGCMAQNIGLQIQKKYPDVVKMVWGTYNKQDILHYLQNLESGNHLEFNQFEFMPAEHQNLFSFKAFLPISHGCDNFCSYCIVPHVRGREVHRKKNDILDDVKRLIDNGVKEISLLGQNVNSYIDGQTDFPALLNETAQINGLERLTFLTSHPKDFSRELADVIIANDNIMKYVHLPFQAGNNRILKLMNRKYTSEDYLRKIEIAKTIPGVTLSTDIMVGFPTETDGEFEDTIKMVETVRYHEAFTYRYNVRPGTKAADMTEQVPETVKLERLDRLIRVQNQIAAELLAGHVGHRYSVLCEKVSKKNKNQLTCRAHNGLMAFAEGDASMIGQVVDMDMTAVSGAGLKGVIVK